MSSYLRDLVLPSWIGLSDLLVENQYGWSDGVSPVLYTNWNDKEPNNAGGAVRILNLHYSIWSKVGSTKTHTLSLKNSRLSLDCLNLS